MNDDTAICDRCANYSQSPGGCTESCAENLSNPYYLTRYYYEQRRDGLKRTCKGFRKLPERIKDHV